MRKIFRNAIQSKIHCRAKLDGSRKFSEFRENKDIISIMVGCAIGATIGAGIGTLIHTRYFIKDYSPQDLDKHMKIKLMEATNKINQQ
jgi:chorismate synthase